ncbi:LacI family DNA-binding transcriptional regulator [Rathayibacter sp. VKM Ac-2857]|uniref:LacI family DNA-binding transcriptional regulator n=1 Tax=Rathayibacter sp. VKM Ac-2857 TaxID=2739020 RepID=UPI0015653731|nr:LacI family DNA-binding transcriptional regulator [Rathayibacter sp. VKM Ac-2857]NQX17358.1 LacI family DNA-binding transcriptional regulator [Rathayibacter sp. VKM Ac-2857]
MTNTTATEKRVTAADIARAVGVSRATVGFVLNDTPGQTISEATKTRVLDAARRLGYRPHLAAQALARGRSRIILLVLPDWPMEYSMRRHVDEASIALDEAGYSLVTMTPHAGGKARPLWETLQPDVVMGMMPFTSERVEEIRAAGVPVVIPAPEDRTERGELSFTGGPRLQVEHLLARGHRRIVFAASSDPRLGELVASRFAVAAAAALASGILGLERVDVDGDHVKELVAQWHRAGITGVVAYNDDIAALVVGAAVRLGLAVPADLAVVGHDDSPLARVFLPALTSVHVDDAGLGRYFAQLALAAAKGESAPATVPDQQVSLIERESS